MAWGLDREGRQAPAGTGRRIQAAPRAGRTAGRVEPAAAQEEMTRAWQAMDDRARAGVKMTLAGLTLSQQAAPSSAEAKRRLERLKALHALVDQANQGAPAGARAASTEAAFTAGAARVTNTLADVAERAKPRAGQLIESARKGIEQHGPAVEAAVKSVITELLKADAQPKSGASNPATAAPAARSGRAAAHSRGSAAARRGSVRGSKDHTGPVVRHVAPPRRRRHAWLRSACRAQRQAGVGVWRHERAARDRS